MKTDNEKLVTAADEGITGDEQIKIALQVIVANNGIAQMGMVQKA